MSMTLTLAQTDARQPVGPGRHRAHRAEPNPVPTTIHDDPADVSARRATLVLDHYARLLDLGCGVTEQAASIVADLLHHADADPHGHRTPADVLESARWQYEALDGARWPATTPPSAFTDPRAEHAAVVQLASGDPAHAPLHYDVRPLIETPDGEMTLADSRTPGTVFGVYVRDMLAPETLRTAEWVADFADAEDAEAFAATRGMPVSFTSTDPDECRLAAYPTTAPAASLPDVDVCERAGIDPTGRDGAPATWEDVARALLTAVGR